MAILYNGYPTPAAKMIAEGTAPWETYKQGPQAGDEVGSAITVTERALSTGEKAAIALKEGVSSALVAQSFPPEIAQAGMPGMLVGAALGAIGGALGIPALGEIIGGDTVNGNGGETPALDVPLVGPGVPEPPGAIVAKRWETRVYSNTYGYIKINFYKLTDGRIMCYNNTTRVWKIWRPRKNIVLSSNPRLKDLKKLDRVYQKMQKAVRKFAPRPKQRVPVLTSKYLSPVERAAIK